MSEETPPDSASKERNSLTLGQRRALRHWANSQLDGRPSHKKCIEWFQQQYNQTISQSTVSHSLSPKYARLDGDPQLSGSRLRFGNWPDVEKLVLMWYQQASHQGRTPSNDELADKAKSIFTQLPRYKDSAAPEFSPGWIHRFKRRYGLLIRRQRRGVGAPVDPATDVAYLVEAVPRLMLNVAPDTSPSAIRDSLSRVLGVECTLAMCARVRDEIVHGGNNNNNNFPPETQPTPQEQHQQQPLSSQHALSQGSIPPTGPSVQEWAPQPDEDPEIVLQNALRQLQQEEADAEAAAAAAREGRENPEARLITGGSSNGNGNGNGVVSGVGASVGNGSGSGTVGDGGSSSNTAASSIMLSYPQHVAAGALASTSTSTPPPKSRSSPAIASGMRFNNPLSGAGEDDLTLTPIASSGPVSANERPLRCPYCINTRMLRTIKEAVEHMSTHVVV